MRNLPVKPINFARCGRLLAASRRGVTSIEYAVIAALVAVAIVAGAITLGSGISNSFSAAAAGLSGTSAAATPPSSSGTSGSSASSSSGSSSGGSSSTSCTHDCGDNGH